MLNSVGAILFHLDQSEAIEAGKLLFRAARERQLSPEARSAAVAIARDPLPLIRAAGRYFILRRPALDPSAPPQLTVGSEQVPNPASRVFLSRHRDAMGMRRIALDWQTDRR